MAWKKITKMGVCAAAILVVAGIAMLVATGASGFLRRGRLRLPVGNGTPAISLGERHGLILASDGSLWAWGSDFLGWPVLGLGNVEPQTRLRRIGKETNWVCISAGTTHNVAIKSDGTLWAWGQNLYGQFGSGNGGRKNPMANVPVPGAPGHDWKQAVAGGIHTAAIKQDGTLWTWGNNWAGSLGTGSTNNSAFPVQVGSVTNWVSVWAGTLETVALQSDGSLWYWGDNPDPAVDMKVEQVFVPKRVSADTNWVDVGFGPWTVFAIKSDGTLWTWGRNAHFYTGARDPALDATPMRVGGETNWASIRACGLWWCQGLVKKDGSFWLMDESNGEPNGPGTSPAPLQFRRLDLPKDIVAYSAGAAHAAAPGMHGPIGAALTRDGEVWTWGLVLGDPRSIWGRLGLSVFRIASQLGFKGRPSDAEAVIRQTPWRLPSVDASASE
jgi:alpha-tubulin suppressor-like RCC1 family protein